MSKTSDSLVRARVPNPYGLTDEHLDVFLEAIREGHTRPEACVAIAEHGGPEVTATRMKALLARDPGFQVEYAVALEQGDGAYQDVLVDIQRERVKTSDRQLRIELATRVPEYRWLQGSHVKHSHMHSGRVALDAAQLDQAPLERLRELRDALQALHDALPEDDIVDGEAEEIT